MLFKWLFNILDRYFIPNVGTVADFLQGDGGIIFFHCTASVDAPSIFFAYILCVR